jgi:hypothetical protein
MLALSKASGCCSFTTAATAILQNLISRHKKERNMLPELIRAHPSKKKAIFLDASP